MPLPSGWRIKMLPTLKRHIFTAHAQWHSQAISRESISEQCVITVEDYQQNIDVVYIEKIASMAYSSNKLTLAVYPICVEYQTDDDLKKGAICFISDDNIHDIQQVCLRILHRNFTLNSMLV